MTSLNNGWGSGIDCSLLPGLGLASGVSSNGDPENESDCDNLLLEFSGLLSEGARNLLLPPLDKVNILESKLCK